MNEDRVIPLFPLNLVLFPDMVLPLHIFEERYRTMIQDCLTGNGEFGIVYQDGATIMNVGCTARIIKVLKRYGDGRMDILTAGSWRFHIEELIEDKPYLEAQVATVTDREHESVRELIDLAREGTRQLEELQRYVRKGINLGNLARMELTDFSFIIAANDLFSSQEKQRFLEMEDTGERLRESTASLKKVLWKLRVKGELKRLFSPGNDFSDENQH
jgi:ATP-dependent Lon protease